MLTKADYADGEDDEVEVKIERFSRTVLKLTLAHPSPSVPDVTAFVAHLKAKLPTRVRGVPSKHKPALGTAISAIRRTAEAAAIRVMLTEQMKSGHVPTALLGDLNDDPRSNALAILSEQPGLSRRSRGSDTGLYSALSLQQLQSLRDVYYTHEYNGVRDTLDHILVSEEFYENSNRAKWSFREAKILNDSIDDESKATSDHGVISAHFGWGRR